MSVTQLMALSGALASGGWDGQVHYLIIGGGGGAAGRHAGGGGAGGYRTSWAGSGSELSGGTPGTLESPLSLEVGVGYNIQVGQGGGFGVDGYRGNGNPSKGGGSRITHSSITNITSLGGGAGAGGNDTNSGQNASRGGSDGGSSPNRNDVALHTNTNQGHAGGASGITNTPYVGGGGGGAGGAGQTGYQNARGGASRTSSITGVSVARAGGGGGGQYYSGYSWVGTNGGGGAGNGTMASGSGTYAGDALAHTGSGGGGGGGDYSNGGNGASGIVIFRLSAASGYSASQLSSDMSSLSNLTATYLNTKVYTDDTNYSNVILQLDGNESTLKDVSSYTKNVNLYNTPVQSTSIKKYGAGSIDLASTNKAIYGEDGDFLFGTNDFTIEGWIYRTSSQISASQNQIFFANYNSWSLGSIFFGFHNSNSGKMAVYIRNQSTSQILTDPTQHAADTWVHYALTRNGTTLTLWRDGSSVSTTTLNSNLNTTSGGSAGNGRWSIGQHYPVGTNYTDWYLRGHVDDIRITKNVARYTNSFTPAENVSSTNATGGDHIITFTITDASGGNQSSGSGASATNRGSSNGTGVWTPFS